MHVETVPLTSISLYPGNPRKGSVAHLVQSLTQDGQYKPLIVQASTGYIVAGNHTWLAMSELGLATCDIIRHPCDDETARRILIKDNRLFELGQGWDLDALADILGEMIDPSSSGFTPEAMDDLLSAVDQLPVTSLDQWDPPPADYIPADYVPPSRPFSISDEDLSQERERWRDAQPISAFGIREKILKYPQSEWDEATALLSGIMRHSDAPTESAAALRAFRFTAARLAAGEELP